MTIRLSPTQFKVYDACERHWVLNYPMRQRHVEKPSRGKMLGTITHACLEAHARGASIYRSDLSAEKTQKEIDAFVAEFDQFTFDALLADAPQRAVMVLPKLPTAATHHITPEHQLTLDVEAIDPGAGWELADGTATDLMANPHVGDWVEIYDYKTTKGAALKKGAEMKHGGPSTGWDPWAYVPTEKELRADPQVILYATYAMQKSGKRVAVVRFIYICTHGSPREPKIVELKITEAECRALLAEHILPVARELVRLHGQYYGRPPEEVNGLRLPVLPSWDRNGPCQAYGGCPHHISRGGVCRADNGSRGLGNLAREGARNTMGLFDKARQLDQSNRAPEALQAAAKADPVGAEVSGLEVPEVVTEPPPVPRAEVAAPPAPKGAGRPRRTAKDTDETYAARVREWEKANNVVTTEGEAVSAAPVVVAPKAPPEPTPAEVHAALEAVKHPVLQESDAYRQVSITLTGSVADVRALIRGLGGAL